MKYHINYDYFVITYANCRIFHSSFYLRQQTCVANVTKNIDIVNSFMLNNNLGIIPNWKTMDSLPRKNKIKRLLLITVGVISLIFGGFGIILPLLPTTPFVLLAAACFSYSSPKLAKRLETSRVFGTYLRHWRTKSGIPLKTKIRALLLLWPSLIISAIIARTLLITLLLGVIGTIVTLHLILIKTNKEDSVEVLKTTRVDS